MHQPPCRFTEEHCEQLRPSIRAKVDEVRPRQARCQRCPFAACTHWPPARLPPPRPSPAAADRRAGAQGQGAPRCGPARGVCAAAGLQRHLRHARSLPSFFFLPLLPGYPAVCVCTHVLECDTIESEPFDHPFCSLLPPLLRRRRHSVGGLRLSEQQHRYGGRGGTGMRPRRATRHPHTYPTLQHRSPCPSPCWPHLSHALLGLVHRARRGRRADRAGQLHDRAGGWGGRCSWWRG